MIVLDALQEILLHRFITIKVWKGFHFVKSLMKKGYLKFFL
jgi:hypothetical protein